MDVQAARTEILAIQRPCKDNCELAICNILGTLIYFVPGILKEEVISF